MTRCIPFNDDALKNKKFDFITKYLLESNTRDTLYYLEELVDYSLVFSTKSNKKIVYNSTIDKIEGSGKMITIFGVIYLLIIFALLI